MRIREKLVLIFFISIVIPMFLVWARWQGTVVGSIKSVLRQGLAERTHDISDQITSELQVHQSELLNLTGKPAIRAYSRAIAQNNQAQPDGELRIALSTFLLSQQNGFSAIIGVNRLGNPVFKIEPKSDADGIMKPYIQDRGFPAEDSLRPVNLLTDTRQGAVFTSELEQGVNGSHVRIAAPLRDDSGNVTGALVLKINAAALLRNAAGPGMTKTVQDRTVRLQTIILSPDGTVIFCPDPAKLSKPYTEAYRDFEQPLTSLRKEKAGDTDWQPYLIRHQFREAGPQMSIFLLENYSDAISQLEFDGYVLLLLTFLLVVVAMLVLYYMISNTTDSIRRVTSGARAIATGNLGYKISVKSKDETRVLAEAFNRMAARLRDMIRKEGEQKQFESFARLSSVLTHDLKNQILSLSLLVSNMERKFDREGFKEDAMKTLADSVSNLNNLVTKLSDPRTPTKRIRDNANITTLVDRVIQRTAAQATNKFKVSAQLTPELYAVVDGKAIERVIENLVINALEAMPEGGTLRVRTWMDGSHAIVAIADTGKGMTEEFMRERLFHPFATTKKKGIGLGLYSCRDIIEQHGGRIDVASKIDVGTEFKIVLPLKHEDVREDSGEVKAVTV